MVNVVTENQCDISDCDEPYKFTLETGEKLCYIHHPDFEEHEIVQRRKCKYCDIEEKSKFICKRCQETRNKKEVMVVRQIRKNVHTKFLHDTSVMLGNCSKRRPDVFFDLQKHCLLVEIDEEQHKHYDDLCECARINEIVNSIGGRSIIIIRFNPDKVKHNGRLVREEWKDRIELLIQTIKEELVRDHDQFKVEIIQMYYDQNYKGDEYNRIQRENITDLVTV